MEDKLTTKDKILETSIALIKEKGFDSVTIKEICNECNISKHTFYYYFSSKEELLRSYFIIKREINALDINDIINAENNIEIFFKLIEPITDFFESIGVEILKQVLIINLTKGVGTFHTDIHSSINKKDIHTLEISTLKKAQKAGEIRNTTHPVKLAKICYKLHLGIAVTWCLKNGSFNLKETTRICLEDCLDVIENLRTTKK